MTLKKFSLLKPYIEGKKVLHLGCVEHDWREALKDSWIHSCIVEHSREAVGLDILEDDLKQLAKRGYKVEHGDAENFALGTKYDVIFAGELIEHLENFRGFLESCKRHMKPDSKLILTTPNSHGIRYMLFYLLGRRFIEPEHTCWFDVQTIEQLLNRHNLKIIEKKFVSDYAFANLKRPFIIILQVIERLLPKKYASNLFIVATQK